MDRGRASGRILPAAIAGQFIDDERRPANDDFRRRRLAPDSKQESRRGYTIHWGQRTFRDIGRNSFPERITIDTLDDLLKLAGREREFADACRVANRLRRELPELAGWMASNVRKLHLLAEPLDGLVAVTQFFLANPWPDCYARQLPVAVDTKFVERHQAWLRAWLDFMLPASAIQADETDSFARRFGLRDGEMHITLRVLDPELQRELQLQFDEFSVPLRYLEPLPVRDATVFISENRLNVLTLPPFPRGIALWGQGKAASVLRKLEWLANNRVVYWGDIDVEGFHILSQLRGQLPDGSVRSLLMDAETLQRHPEAIVQGNAANGTEPPLLTSSELAAYRRCAEHRHRLEQEKIAQSFVDERVRELLVSSRPPRPQSCFQR